MTSKHIIDAIETLGERFGARVLVRISVDSDAEVDRIYAEIGHPQEVSDAWYYAPKELTYKGMRWRAAKTLVAGAELDIAGPHTPIAANDKEAA